MPDEPQCPDRHGPMILRTATKGRNPGTQFWGCAKYPQCEATLSLADALATAVADPEARSRISRVLEVTPHHPTSEVDVWDSRATLYDGTEHLGDKAAPQLWGLESNRSPQAIATGEVPRLVTAIEKLLSRGRWILLDPDVDRYIAENRAALTEACRRIPRCSFNPEAFNFDAKSKAEKDFSIRVAEKYGDPAMLHPQVPLAALTDDPPAQQRRVDFLAFTSDGPLIIEIDGPDHLQPAQAALDKVRDAAAQRAGVKVQRILTEDVASAALSTSLIAPPRLDPAQFCHVLWVALLWGLKTGNLPLGGGEWVVEVETGLIDPRLSDLAQRSVDGFLRLAGHLGELFGVPGPLAGNVCVRAGNAATALARSDQTGGTITVHFQLIRRGAIARGHVYYRELLLSCQVPRRGKVHEPRALKPVEGACRYFLEYVFRHESFREGQWEGIRRALEGNDSLVLLPTGAGKSVMYLLPALLRPGVGIVVDPIISLIDDQVDNLRRVGIDRVVGISSDIDHGQKKEVIEQFSSGEYLVTFVAPERFQMLSFRQALMALTPNCCVSLIAIDEAHCISEWGHDFRTAYLNLGRNARSFCSSRSIEPPLMCLTGTASRAVLKDIKRETGVSDFDAVITPRTFDRKELSFEVLSCDSTFKQESLKGLVERLLRSPANQAGIVFCLHVNGEFGTVRVADRLNTPPGPIPMLARSYSGTPPNGYGVGQWKQIKKKTAADFKGNKFPVMVATSAFGMGIDKANVRFTIHYGIPSSIESFYQEAGRAGRDRSPAVCAIIASNDQPDRTNRLLAEGTQLRHVDAVIKALAWADADDVTRALFFHVQSFAGAAREEANGRAVLAQIPDLDGEAEVIISCTEAIELPDLEKAVHRLVTVGFLRDYTLDYSNKRIVVRPSGASPEGMVSVLTGYISNYSVARAMALRQGLSPTGIEKKDFVLKLVSDLLEFVYSTLELGRRRALLEMVQVCGPGATDASVRQRVMAYLEKSEFDEFLETVRENLQDRQHIERLLDEVASPNQAMALRGVVGRHLESYPDNPGLLFLRGVVETMCRDADMDIAVSSLRNWAESWVQKYALPEPSMAAFHSLAIDKCAGRGPGLPARICKAVFPVIKSRDFYSGILSHSRNQVESTMALSELIRMQAEEVKTIESELVEVIR